MLRAQKSHMSVRLGYACINLTLKELDIYSTRTAILNTVAKDVNILFDIAKQNLIDLEKIIKYNERQGYRFFRLSSNLFPHLENPKLLATDTILSKYRPSQKEFAAILRRIGKYARENAHRLTMHPGQYVQLGSTDPNVVKQSIIDLNLHAEILQTMDLLPEHGSVLIIHGGGTFGNKPESLKRWRENFKKLPKQTAQYIALENDEFQYNVLDLLPLCEELKIPLCVDFFHHEVSQRRHTERKLEQSDDDHIDYQDPQNTFDQLPTFDIFDPKIISRVCQTWKQRGIKPKCHYSEQKPDARDGAHSDCVHNIPANILQFAKTNHADIMLEVKDKDLCLGKIYEKHFIKSIGTSDTDRVEWYMK